MLLTDSGCLHGPSGLVERAVNWLRAAFKNPLAAEGVPGFQLVTIAPGGRNCIAAHHAG